MPLSVYALITIITQIVLEVYCVLCVTGNLVGMKPMKNLLKNIYKNQKIFDN